MEICSEHAAWPLVPQQLWWFLMVRFFLWTFRPPTTSRNLSNYFFCFGTGGHTIGLRTDSILYVRYHYIYQWTRGVFSSNYQVLTFLLWSCHRPVTLESNSTSYYTTNEPRVYFSSSSALCLAWLYLLAAFEKAPIISVSSSWQTVRSKSTPSNSISPFETWALVFLICIL